jgi:hypothetical protein
MSEGSVKSKVEGAALLADAMRSLPYYTEQCHSMKDDMPLFLEWASLFLDPVTARAVIEQNLLDNKAKLILDLAKVKRLLGKEEYF